MKLTLLVVLAAASVFAQLPETNWATVKNLPFGEQIRISLEGGKSFQGQLQNVTDESLVIVAATSQETLARAQVIKIATKRDSHRRRNALIGLGIGAGAGLAVGIGSDHACAPRGCFFGNNFGKEVMTPIGAILGTIIGAVWPTGGWHEVYRSK